MFGLVHLKKGSHIQMDLQCQCFGPSKRLPRPLVQTDLTLKNKHFDDFANGAWQLILHIKVFFYMHSEKQKFSNLQSTTHLPGPRPDPDGESSPRTADSAWLCLESVNTPRIQPAVQKGGYGTPRTIIRTPKSLEIWD